MGRRLLAFVLASVVSGAPVAAAVCQLTCAAHDMDAASAAAGTEHHSCHGQASTSGPAVSGGAHLCGHPDEFPKGTEQSLQVAAPAVVVATILFVPPDAGAASVRTPHVDQRPPSHAALSTSLRI